MSTQEAPSASPLPARPRWLPTRARLRVTQLTATRGAALDAHAAELRRIERSLHDGTQNRIVAVAVLLDVVAATEARRRQPGLAVLA